MSRISAKRTLLLLLSLLPSVSATAAQDPPSEETIAFFRLNCTSCHTIGGGPLTGPDLKDVLERADEDWLVRFILDPEAVIDSGDPYAAELVRQARGVVMTKVPGIDRTLAGKLIKLIVAESAKERSDFAGLRISDRALTDEDVSRGRRLFLGAEEYQNGSPACVACHHVSDIGALGGGRLGPDLTSAYDRLEGRKALSAWLGSPPSRVMQPVFREHTLEGEEILALVAYLASVAASEEKEGTASTLEFLLFGFGGSVLLLLVFDFLWRSRYRATRRPLVRRNSTATMGSNS